MMTAQDGHVVTSARSLLMANLPVAQHSGHCRIGAEILQLTGKAEDFQLSGSN